MLVTGYALKERPVSLGVDEALKKLPKVIDLLQRNFDWAGKDGIVLYQRESKDWEASDESTI